MGQGVNRLDMSFNGKYYDNVKFTSIGENKEREFSHDCFTIAPNLMFTKMSAKKGIELFKESALTAIVKEYTQLGDINVVGRKIKMRLHPNKGESHLEL